MSFSDGLLRFWSKSKRRVFIAQWEQGLMRFFRFTQYLRYQTQIFISDIHGHVNEILGASVENLPKTQNHLTVGFSSS